MREDDLQVTFDCKYQLRKYEEDQIQRYEIRVLLGEFEVMRVRFTPDNLKADLIEKFKQAGSFLILSEEQRKRIYAEARERLAQQGVEDTSNIKDFESKALRAVELGIIMASIEPTIERAIKNLPTIVKMVWEKLIQSVVFSSANEARDILHAQEQKYSEKEIKEAMFHTDWERLKPLIINPKPRGGSAPEIEVSDEQCAQISTDYRTLLEHWRNVRSWHKSRQNWRAHAKLDQPDTPDDLLDKLSSLDTYERQPSALAHEHAARRCGIPENTYSLSSLSRLRRRGDKFHSQSKSYK